MFVDRNFIINYYKQHKHFEYHYFSSARLFGLACNLIKYI